METPKHSLINIDLLAESTPVLSVFWSALFGTRIFFTASVVILQMRLLTNTEKGGTTWTMFNIYDK